MNNPDISNTPEDLYLSREASMAAYCVGGGLEQIRKYNFTQKGFFYSGMYQFTSGLERLCKLILIYDFRSKNNNNFPNNEFIKNCGHNINSLFQKVKDTPEGHEFGIKWGAVGGLSAVAYVFLKKSGLGNAFVSELKRRVAFHVKYAIRQTVKSYLLWKAMKRSIARFVRYGHNWKRASLQEAIDKFAGPNYFKQFDVGKIRYKNLTTGVEVIEDVNGGYFRIFDPNIPNKRKYVDIDGKPLPNNVLKQNGKQRGMLDGEYEQLTHYLNEDD